MVGLDVPRVVSEPGRCCWWWRTIEFHLVPLERLVHDSLEWLSQSLVRFVDHYHYHLLK